jgi:hypothetical protein
MKFFYLSVFGIIMLISNVVHSLENLNTFKLPASILQKSSVGLIRVFCFDKQLFASYSSRSGFAAVEPLVSDFGTPASKPLDCATRAFSTVSEHQVGATLVGKSESGVARVVSIRGAHLLLYTTRKGGGSLRQFK